MREGCIQASCTNLERGRRGRKEGGEEESVRDKRRKIRGTKDEREGETGRDGTERVLSPRPKVHALLLSVSEDVGERLVERSEALERDGAVLVARDRDADRSGRGMSRSSQ
jgi:hypothetical protein